MGARQKAQPTNNEPVTIKDVHAIDVYVVEDGIKRQSFPTFTFMCICHTILHISAADDAEPVECPACGMTWDINISVTGSKPEA